jgi:hypothetical protein
MEDQARRRGFVPGRSPRRRERRGASKTPQPGPAVSPGCACAPALVIDGILGARIFRIRRAFRASDDPVFA